jgi:mRNA-degrading endonuclease RelE of RelBE toxin-antitoxin system
MPSPSYDVQLTRAAERDLKRLKASLKQATDMLQTLQANPEAGEALSANLKGVRSLHWRVAGVEYRAAYLLLEKERVCAVFLVGSRENFYREAAKRLDAVTRGLGEGALPQSQPAEEAAASDLEYQPPLDVIDPERPDASHAEVMRDRSNELVEAMLRLDGTIPVESRVDIEWTTSISFRATEVRLDSARSRQEATSSSSRGPTAVFAL